MNWRGDKANLCWSGTPLRHPKILLTLLLKNNEIRGRLWAVAEEEVDLRCLLHFFSAAKQCEELRVSWHAEKSVKLLVVNVLNKKAFTYVFLCLCELDVSREWVNIAVSSFNAYHTCSANAAMKWNSLRPKSVLKSLVSVVADAEPCVVAASILVYLTIISVAYIP